MPSLSRRFLSGLTSFLEHVLDALFDVLVLCIFIPPSRPTPISDLPDDVLEYCFSFVGPPGHFRNIATTSRRFRDVHCSHSPILILSAGLLKKCFSFVGMGDYRFIAGTNRRFRDVYRSLVRYYSPSYRRIPRAIIPPVTTFVNAMISIPRAELYLEDANKSRGWRTREKKMDLFEAAIKTGRVDVLNMLLGSGLPVAFVRLQLFQPAVRAGHVNVLEWADSHSLPWCEPIFDATTKLATQHGRTNILDFLFRRERSTPGVVWRLAVNYAQIAVLDWMKESNLLAAVKDELGLVLFPWYHAVCYDASCSVLDWIWDNRATLALAGDEGEALVCPAIMLGRENILVWARDRGVAFDDAYFCQGAAFFGELTILQLLREQGCPWNDSVVDDARSRGFHDLAEWAIAHGCPTPP